MNVPGMVQDQVTEVLHEKLFWNGFTMTDPIGNPDFWVKESDNCDSWGYKHTLMLELCHNSDGSWEIKEYC